LYGARQTRGEPERRLFPGAIPILLAAVALLLRVPSRAIVLYVVVAVAAFEASFGFRGYFYSFLHEHVRAFHALRAPARLGVFVVFSLAVLAGFGYTFLVAPLRARGRLIVLVLLLTGVLAEFFTRPTLVAYPTTPPPVYRLLATLPPGTVAEFPMPKVDGLPGPDPKYAYSSVFHWKPLVNGYSGFYPPTYVRRLVDLRRFPEPFSLRVLRRENVRYMVVHESGYADRELYEQTVSALDAAEGVRSLGAFSDGEGDAIVYALR
jgi:hypothetical protein